MPHLPPPPHAESKLDALLESRRYEPPRHDLAERIIAAAPPRKAPRASAWSLRETLVELLAPLLLPPLQPSFARPAMAFSVMLMLGFTLGQTLLFSEREAGESFSVAAEFTDEGAML